MVLRWIVMYFKCCGVLVGWVGLVPVLFAQSFSIPGLSEAQISAAIAVERVFNELQLRIDNGETLSANEFALYDGTREIVHTANQILNVQTGSQLPTEYSLNLDAEGYYDVLRWVAHEEIGAQGDLTAQSSQAQSANIGARLSALRMGATGFQVSFQRTADPLLNNYSSGSAGEANTYTGLGAFLNGSVGFGERDPSTREDAFTFETWSLTGGLDYRLTTDWLIGVAFGLSENVVDFDGSQSIVDGKIETTSWQSTAYTAYNWSMMWMDAAIGYGQGDLAMERRISYPSNNVLIAATNELALATTDSEQFNSALHAGADFFIAGYTFGPTLGVNYIKADIDGYRETNANEFNLQVQGQSIESLTVMAGFQWQYAASQPWGVLLPQMNVDWLHEFKTNDRSVGAKFTSDTADNYITVLTDKPDADYGTLGLSLSAVFKNGLQGFVHYERVFELDKMTSYRTSGGVRWEF